MSCGIQVDLRTSEAGLTVGLTSPSIKEYLDTLIVNTFQYNTSTVLHCIGLDDFYATDTI